ncbi:HIT-like domain-containing protein [Podospora aff. communis PSN243]|uniref:Bis(5'-adenosyl)-triphosphatase n=1 Tax=Podospora aff. communis PSN243 TaxID=3040156 RepID=A0AAV9H1C1_9PEZI|nr:HIT-like domain-containing protein [Podospora aff. communis PSN243]
MSTSTPSNPPQRRPVHFGPFEVTNQVFLTTPHSFALVNLKPLLPGHVLVCPIRPHRRLTELSPAELTDLWSSVQRVQRMLARHYFLSSPSPSSPPPQGSNPQTPTASSPEYLGSFNIALQDGPESGQTVPHVHVHVIPRIRGCTAKSTATPSDELYDRMASEDGNVGGWQWDHQQSHQGRPQPGGQFPRIEDAERMARGMEEMEAEAALYQGLLRAMEKEEREVEESGVRREVESVVPF